MKRWITFALLVSLLPLAVVAEEEKDTSKPCILVDRILYVDKLDEHQVLVKLRGGKQYILGVEKRCRGLDKAIKFAVTGSTNRACPDRLSRIQFTEKSRRTDDCRIETITEVTGEDLDTEDQAVDDD